MEQVPGKCRPLHLHSTIRGRIGRGRLHRVEEAKDEHQLPVPLVNHVQGKADESIIIMEPTILKQVCARGLPFVSEIGLSLPDGVLAFQLIVPHLFYNISPKR